MYIQYSCCILVNEADELYRYTPRYPEHAARKTEIRKISLHRVVWLQRIFIVSSVETSVVEFKNNTKSIGPLDSVMIKKKITALSESIAVYCLTLFDDYEFL